MSDSKKIKWGQSFAVGVAAITVVAILQRFVGLGRSLVVCRWLESDDLGRWDLSFGFLVALGPLVVMGIPGAFGRFAERYRIQGKTDRFIIVTAIACLMPLVLAIGLMMLFPKQVSQFWFHSNSDTSWLWQLLPALCLVVVFNYLCSLTSALRLHTSFAWVQAIHGIGFATLCLLLIPLMAYGSEAVVIAYSIACIIGSIFLIHRLRSALAQSAEANGLIVGESQENAMPLFQNLGGLFGDAWEMMRVILPFALAVWVATFIGNAFSMSGRLLLLHASEDECVGLFLVGQYHTATIVPRLISQFAATISAMATPHLASDWEQGNRSSAIQKLETLLKLFSVGTTIVAIAVMIAAPTVFTRFLGERFDLALEMLPWVLAMTVIYGLTFIIQNAFWCANRSWWGAIAFLVALVINIALTFLLLPLMGPMSIVVSMFFATIASMFTMLLLAGKVEFRFSGSTWATLMLPIVLVAGPLVSTLMILAVAASTIWSDGFFSLRERQRVRGVLEQRFPSYFATT